jgi:tRNA(Arg) A34 adenosine deaminase TadA
MPRAHRDYGPTAPISGPIIRPPPFALPPPREGWLGWGTERLQNFQSAPHIRALHGIACPYCFKDAYNAVKREKNQVHTRSLHAEENAFLQLARRGSSGIAGGVLYTTASPCELCSKKAFQLGVNEVVYVDPYPGISASHILGSGIQDLRPILRLFSGAVGPAYHRLYESLMPIKDELGARLDESIQQELPL